MANFNKIIIIGNLTKDPELKQLPSGQNFCKLTIASNYQFKNKQTGLSIQEVCFIDVDIWGAQATSCQQYLQKGKSILVEGRLKLDSWKDQQGNPRSKHGIVAERVTFLNSNPQVESESDGEKEVFSKSNNSKGEFKDIFSDENSFDKNSNEKFFNKNKKNNNLESAGFKDTAPFGDELPF